MNQTAAVIVLLLLLIGPLTIRPIEHNIEIFILGVGIIATILSGGPRPEVIQTALLEPVPITIVVIIASLIFRAAANRLDAIFASLRERTRRATLAATSIFIVALLSSLITAIVAALVLVEIAGLLRLQDRTREKVVVAGCFAIGLGASLTPVGEPLSTLAADALGLGFFGLFRLLAAWVIPGVAAMAILAGYFAAGEYTQISSSELPRKTWLGVIRQGGEVFGFVAGLVLISEAYAPLARQIVPRFGNAMLFWANMLSAVLDNATLVALEAGAVPVERALGIILALLISGGMLIPGNIPNVIAAGALKITSSHWASVAIPIGLALLGIYFALLQVANFVG